MWVLTRPKLAQQRIGEMGYLRVPLTGEASLASHTKPHFLISSFPLFGS
jgi:hypothetical protein